jgi:hypothetical protein
MTSAFLALASLLLAGGTQSALEAEADRFAHAWAEKNVRQLGELMAEAGIRLHLPGEEHQLIRLRQARAALGTFLERYAGGEANVVRVSAAEGGSEKGFAEISWTTGSPGATEPVIFTLFVGYALIDAEGWTVTEIRVLY